jgi:hypothetical protein
LSSQILLEFSRSFKQPLLKIQTEGPQPRRFNGLGI